MNGISLLLCVNNKYGNVRHWCESINVELDGDLLMELACNVPFVDLGGYISLNGKLMQHHGIREMVGNVFWNAYRIDARQLVDLLNSLKQDAFISITSGEVNLFRKWDSDEPYTLSDFGYDDAAVHMENLLRDNHLTIKPDTTIANWWLR